LHTIVYLIEQPLDDRNYRRFGVQTWIDRGWNVEVWDLTPWAYPHGWQSFTKTGGVLSDFTGYYPIVSRKQLTSRMRRQRVGVYIDFTEESYYSVQAKSVLSRNGAVRVVCATGAIPLSGQVQANSVVERLRRAVHQGAAGWIKWLSKKALGNLVARQYPPGLRVVSGRKTLPNAASACEILRAHSFDYDTYLSLKAGRCAPVRDFITFIDQDYCFHSDNMYYGAPFLMSPERYFPAICNGLRVISAALSADVRIAAHPRARYGDSAKDYFEGLPIEYGRTPELISGAKAVVCHDSTAIQFAVLFGKPLIFVTTDELIPSIGGRSTLLTASMFGKTPINLDTDLRSVDWRSQLCVDTIKYAEYRNDYIKMDGSPERPFWDIVSDHFATQFPR
jgi:hypothetical protein